MFLPIFLLEKLPQRATMHINKELSRATWHNDGVTKVTLSIPTHIMLMAAYVHRGKYFCRHQSRLRKSVQCTAGFDRR